MRKLTLKIPDNENFFIQEAYKTLRTNLQFCGQDVKVIVFTSVHENEGKSTIALHTAKSMADLGKRVLLLDADLRKSVMAGRNANVRKTSGLSEVLTGMSSINDSLYATQCPGLHILFAGKYPPNPVELLGSTYFASLLAEARKAYDYVIVDSPPLGQVIDAAIIAPLCDGAVLVVGNDVSASAATNVVNQLKKTECQILGAVRNYTRPERKSIFKFK